jgi:putative addiction module killer protein
MESVTTGLTGGYRIYLAQEGKEFIVLFGGGTKKSQQSDIYRAQELCQEYKTIRFS